MILFIIGGKIKTMMIFLIVIIIFLYEKEKNVFIEIKTMMISLIVMVITPIIRRLGI